MLINSYINEKYSINLRLPDVFVGVSFALVPELLGFSGAEARVLKTSLST